MKVFFRTLLVIILFTILVLPAMSQCAMCTAVADEAAKNGSSAADGINKGVLYLFLSPYLIVGTIGLIWWRSRKRAQEMLLNETGSSQV